MNQPLSSHDLGSDVLKQIEEGMHVVDPDGHKVGTVERIYLGEVDESTAEIGKGPATSSSLPDTGGNIWLNSIEDVFDGNDELPEVVRNRMLQSGFIRVDSGLFSGGTFALPEHIASVSGDEVRLRVKKDDLIKS